MTKDEALKLALEALTHLHPTALTSFYTIGDRDRAITAIKEALAQPDHIRDATKMMAQAEERNFCPRCGKRLGGMRITDAQWSNIHTCTPPVAAGSQAFYGFPNEPVSTPNAGGKCVTAGETAPIKEIDPNQWAFDRGLEST